MPVVLIRGNALALPLPDQSVDLVITSPPYFGLRSYQDGGKHYEGQIGDEATPAEFVDALIAATREMVRVLKPAGSIFVNLGDKYSQRTQTRRSSHQPGMYPGRFDEFAETWAERAAKGAVRMPYQNVVTDAGKYVPEKSLMGLPWRYALRCMDELDLILRAELIWAKPNAMPESVTDRVRRTHEQWFHFVTQPRYFEAVDEIREPYADGATPLRPVLPRNKTQKHLAAADNSGWKTRVGNPKPHPLGALPTSVWDIATQALKVPDWLEVDHYAAYPMEWPRRLIQGWCPKAYCTACGQPRRPVVVTEPMVIRPSARRAAAHANGVGSGRTATSGTMLEPARRWITGYACDCAAPDAPTRPAVVLDPFGGTGTAAVVADVLGRTGISMDLSADYGRIAAWRTTDPGERAAAMQVPRPEQVPETQPALF